MTRLTASLICSISLLPEILKTQTQCVSKKQFPQLNKMFHRNCCRSKYKDVIARTDCLRNLYSGNPDAIFKTRNQAVCAYDRYIEQRGADGLNLKHFHNRPVRRYMSVEGVILKLESLFDGDLHQFKSKMQSAYLLTMEDPKRPRRAIWRCFFLLPITVVGL